MENSAVIIQRTFRVHLMKQSYNELCNLNLNEKAKSTCFDDFTKIMINKEILQTVNKFLLRTKTVCEQLNINNREYQQYTCYSFSRKSLYQKMIQHN